MNFLFFFLSWLCGMLAILLFAFIEYEQFSIIDITSFAVFMFGGCILSFVLIYLPMIRWLNKRSARNKLILYPASLAIIANLPVYCIILWKKGDLYGPSEAFMFLLGTFIAAVVFGICSAWKRSVASPA